MRSDQITKHGCDVLLLRLCGAKGADGGQYVGFDIEADGQRNGKDSRVYMAGIAREARGRYWARAAI